MAGDLDGLGKHTVEKRPAGSPKSKTALRQTYVRRGSIMWTAEVHAAASCSCELVSKGLMVEYTTRQDGSPVSSIVFHKVSQD
jgi:hypothetical protein